MRERHRIWAIAAAALVMAWTAPTIAVTSAQKCQADKLKRTGKYLFCRMKAEAKAVKTAAPADYAKCDAAIADAFAAADASGPDFAWGCALLPASTPFVISVAFTPW